jgi:hypothetical protein
MIPRLLRLQGVTRADRQEMISRVREAIAEGGGYILDFHMFSNIMICINFEVSAGNIGRLHSSLAATGLRLDAESRDLLEDCRKQPKRLAENDKDSEVTGTLNITFVHNEPDLRIEVPPIPG